MAQINKGYNYTTSGANSYVTAGNLNQHVALATLAGGAISEQTANSASNDTDVILIGTGTGLSTAIWKQTKAQFTNTINSASISVNALSVQDAELDSITINGSYDEDVYFNVGNAAIYNSSTTSPYVMFGYDNITHALPVGHTGNVFRHHGISTLFTDPYNPVDLNVAGTGHTVTIQGDLNVTKDLNVTRNVSQGGVVLDLFKRYGAKNGVLFAGGITELYKTQDLDIPADETWVFSFDFKFKSNQLGTATITAYLEKATYSDVSVATWDVIIYGLQHPYVYLTSNLALTRTSLASLSKKLKFVVSGLSTYNTATEHMYSISYVRIKTAQLTTDNSIL